MQLLSYVCNCMCVATAEPCRPMADANNDCKPMADANNDCKPMANQCKPMANQCKPMADVMFCALTCLEAF
jgi:hypothetical protein